MIGMAWELDADRPIYAQLVERIQKEIVSGKYQPGGEAAECQRSCGRGGGEPEYDAESFCGTGAERPDRDTAHQRPEPVTEDTELIGNIREQLAAGHVRNFINNMQELGYQREEIRNLFDKVQA